LTTTAAVVTAIFLTNNIFIIILTHFFSYSVIRLIILLYTLKKYKPNTQQDLKTINYGKHLSAVNILQTVAGNVDKIILWHFLGAAPLAIYSFAIAPPKQIQKLLSSIKTLALPKLAQRPLPEIKKTLPQKVFKMFLILLPITGAYILLAPYLYQLVFPDYLESIFYTQLFALILLFQPIAVIATTFRAHAHKKKIYFLDSSTPIFRILALSILVPLYGLLGAIITILATQLFNLILTLSLFAGIKK
jgi:O-antigen/teichoic acid export membrane protein